jgi:hypothetical protein
MSHDASRIRSVALIHIIAAFRNATFGRPLSHDAPNVAESIRRSKLQGPPHFFSESSDNSFNNGPP